ncbi:AfsR/SARP family transcriptional regulator, partial [Streptomyces hainanensis]
MDLGHARRQCVLVALLADANGVVPVERLADRVWGERPPERARETLYSYLSRLRSAFAPARERLRIERRPGGYLLALDPSAGIVDLHRFRSLVEQAREQPGDERAVVPLERALALWRGEPFASLESPWLNDLRGALLQERLAAELDRNDLRLRHDRHPGLLGELTVGAERNPLNERLAGQLMLALCHEGRSAEALRHYEHFRRELASELGADPGAELQRLHLRILDGDPTLGRP